MGFNPKREGYCLVCGEWRGFSRHHVVPKRTWRTLNGKCLRTARNLVIPNICRGCHKAIDLRLIKEEDKYGGLLPFTRYLWLTMSYYMTPLEKLTGRSVDRSLLNAA